MHIPLEPSDPWRAVQGPTDLWFWGRLGCYPRASDWDLDYVLTASMWNGSRPLLPDASRSIVRGLGGHLGSASDEALEGPSASDMTPASAGHMVEAARGRSPLATYVGTDSS